VLIDTSSHKHTQHTRTRSQTLSLVYFSRSAKMKVATTTRSVLLRFPMGEVVERAPHGRFDAFYDEGIVFLSFYGTERPRAAFLFLVWDNSVFFSLPPSFRGRFSKTKTRQRQDKTKKEIKKTKKIFPASPLSLSLSLSL
jgi:hypothetical protein